MKKTRDEVDRLKRLVSAARAASKIEQARYGECLARLATAKAKAERISTITDETALISSVFAQSVSAHMSRANIEVAACQRALEAQRQKLAFASGRLDHLQVRTTRTERRLKREKVESDIEASVERDAAGKRARPR